ncbi:MAG: 30S ribosomal protein S5 [Candidatus Aenigmatarchaeota archaeon]|nr:30S ribosomal protein S5 [Candidatus Aenigmarchaeota archaeon]
MEDEERVEEVEEIKIEEVPEIKVEEKLSSWKPRTKLGRLVFERKITSLDEILENGIKIKEPEIVDFLCPTMKNELVLIGGRPGKGGGIQRTPIRITAKMHKSGRRYTSSTFAVVGNEDGIVGVGKGRGKEGRLAVEKAVQKAKLSIIKVKRGCGSWECGCGGNHSIPFKVYGRSGSVKVKLMPAPRGVGIVMNDEAKKIIKLAGIEDVWVKTYGNTGARINLIKAIFNALKQLHFYKTGD